MKIEHKIGFIAILYSFILVIVMTLVFDWDHALYAFLGSAVAMFNYSLLLKASKKMTKKTMSTNILIRTLMVLVIFAFVALREDFSIKFLLITLSGYICVKIGVILYYSLFRKKGVDDHD